MVRLLISRQLHQFVLKKQIRTKDEIDIDNEGCTLTEISIMMHSLKQLLVDIDNGIKAHCELERGEINS